MFSQRVLRNRCEARTQQMTLIMVLLQQRISISMRKQVNFTPAIWMNSRNSQTWILRFEPEESHKRRGGDELQQEHFEAAWNHCEPRASCASCWLLHHNFRSVTGKLQGEFMKPYSSQLPQELAKLRMLVTFAFLLVVSFGCRMRLNFCYKFLVHELIFYVF